MTIKFIFITALFLLQSLFLWGTNRDKSVPALKTDAKIIVDGKLQEKIWQTSQPASGFIQYEPGKGAPASLQTEVRVLYNRRYIYFGITCYDSHPQKIAARVSKREGEVSSDDAVAIALDTFKDGQTAYIFFTNLRGTQKDGRLADNGRTFDDTWDGQWLSAGSKTENGWIAEVAVPFETLKYNPGKNRTWGLGVTRFIPRKLEIDTWSGPMESYQRVSQFGSITGLDLKKTGKKSQIIPHVIAKIEKGEKTEIEAGLDVRYAFSQWLSADLTVNPDFATVEADQEQINLTRFELSLKEKRNFFLEGAEIYQQRIRLFYTRRISDIYGGVKVYGKSPGYEFS
ncbi:MAG: carbohydrate binding family 9 domain-containing protein, partial [Candidatus Aminicenantes bacterium]